ncbi:nucleotidyltransferase family protein [Aquirufa sp. OSTEICH-129V]|uniref:Nucleotidyltransferase family protein n=1 Tax=Aquirufa avitistagni TaxID=3104728 RepID=A0ABW6DC01_9BACT
MRHYKEHLVAEGTSILEALRIMDKLAEDAFIFIVDKDDRLLGSLTDGDVRRALIKGLDVNRSVNEILQTKPRFIRKTDFDVNQVIYLRNNLFKIIPILDENDVVINVINFSQVKSYLPLDVVIMAGGRGARLKPLTDITPKPLLKVGEKAIISHNLDRLLYYGIDDFWISVNYLGDQIVSAIGKGEDKNFNVDYIWEKEPLGTIGSVSLIDNFKHNCILITNSDILTNLDYEDFYLKFIESGADFAVVTIPYKVDIPYAVLETNGNEILSFKEKPSYTYYSNGGIYLLKKEVLNLIPYAGFFNATDLMERLIENGNKVISYPLNGYWLDIGKPDDYEKAQRDIHLINLK